MEENFQFKFSGLSKDHDSSAGLSVRIADEDAQDAIG